MNLSDERLVAYIDGELSVAESADTADALTHSHDARTRLTNLKRGGRPFVDAFDAMLDAAPEGELQAMFADLVAQTSGSHFRGRAADTFPSDEDAFPSEEKVVPFRRPLPPAQAEQARRTPLWQMAAAAAVLAVVFTGGLISGGIFNEPQQVAQQSQAQAPGWREAAARYVALFSTDTLHGMPSDLAKKRANLEKVQSELGLKLTGKRLFIPNLDFRGTQLLNFNGAPLAQLAYLDRGQRPVVLCIIPTTKIPAQPAKEVRHGLNIVHWIEGGYGYMVIGDVPEDELNRIATRFRKQFS